MAGNQDNIDFFGERVQRLKFVEDGVSVSAPNSSEACFAQSDDGRWWVRKRVLHTKRPALLAEILGWLLAKELDVPVPDGAVTGVGENLSWLSRVIPAAQHWSPARGNYVRNYDKFGRVLALDAIAFNWDRNGANILLEPRPTKLQLHASCIDFGHSLLGEPKELDAAGLTLPEVDAIAEGLPISLMREGAFAAAEVAEDLTKSLLASMVEEACRITEEPRSEVLIEALWRRTRHARQLTADYVAKLEKVP